MNSIQNLVKLSQDVTSNKHLELLTTQIAEEVKEKQISYIGHFNERAVASEQRSKVSNLNRWIQNVSDKDSVADICLNLLSLFNKKHLKQELKQQLFSEGLLHRATNRDSGDPLILTVTKDLQELRIWFVKPDRIEDHHISSQVSSDLFFGFYHEPETIDYFLNKVSDMFPNMTHWHYA